MATIDKLDISVYNMYAIRTQLIEQAQLNLDQAVTIAPQVQMLDIYPKLSELDILLGNIPSSTPWAFFYPPKSFEMRRRSPFAFYRIVPSLGSLEKQQQDYEALTKTECKSQDEEKEKAVLTKCFNQLDKINSMLSFIVGRVGQFLQG